MSDKISQRLLQISSLPPEEMKAALLAFAAQQQKLENRRSIVQKSTQKWRSKVHGELPKKFTVNRQKVHGEPVHGELSAPPKVHGEPKKPSNFSGEVHGEPAQPALYIVEDRYIEAIQDKEESKKVSKNSNRRISGKRSQIPPDLLCSAKNISDAIKIGLPENIIAFEWSKFHDHHLHKGTLGINWDAGWRRWCQNHMAWNNKPLSAKPLTFHQAAQLHNRSIIHETLFGNAGKNDPQPQRATLGRSTVPALPEPSVNCFDP